MSQSTLHKFTIPWRLIAMIQNLYFPQPLFWADKYDDLTGKYFNKILDIMKSRTANSGLNEIFGSSHYPYIADKRNYRRKCGNFAV